MRYIIASIIILFLDMVGFLALPKSIVLSVIQPVQLGVMSIGGDINDAYKFYGSLENVRNENIGLTQRIIELESVLLDLKSLSEENKVLHEQLNVVSHDLKKNFVIGRVLGNPDDLTGSTIFLDRGSLHGIQAGNNVISGGHLVGVVRKVESNRSLIELIISPGVSISVYDIDSKEKTQGVSIGSHGFAIKMEKILQAESISVGDTIVSSGKDGMFFPGFYVGRVESIESVPSQPLKQAILQPVIDFSKLDRVFVLLN